MEMTFVAACGQREVPVGARVDVASLVFVRLCGKCYEEAEEEKIQKDRATGSITIAAGSIFEG